ncbi:uncharacterized protein LOC114537852 [Dendronephthya gigantea]|uniref:uncharacterized protein LOC114537852 n=1 Tax=Dendronephthya gigantea TaxID=151771 RepID=UPI001069DD12|nr:uncharacterized protein LOC114537852 [Dendronephthya gigantea]
MRKSMSIAIWILAVISISRNVNTEHNLVQQHIERKKALAQDSQLVEISYISKPSVSAIDVSCRAPIAALSFKIVCPALDDPPDLENSRSSNDAGECNSDDEYFQGRGCSHRVRRILSKQVENLANFTCFCWIKEQALPENVKSKASVKIINHGSETTTKTFLRRRINEEKNIHLVCPITGFPQPKITWYKNQLLLNTSEITVIKNVRYRQKNRSLVISRTNLSGSGSYQCLARNAAGMEKGGIYEVEFYEPEAIFKNGSKRQIIIKTNHFTVNHIATTEISKIPSITVNTRKRTEETAADFIKGNNITLYDNKEELDNESENKEGKSGEKITVIAVVVSLSCLVFLVLFASIKCIPNLLKRLHASNGADTGRLNSVNHLGPDFHPCQAAPLCNIYNHKSVPNQDDPLFGKLVALPDVISKPEKDDEIINLSGNSSIQEYQRDPEASFPSSSSFLRASSFHDPEKTRALNTPCKHSITSSDLSETSSKQRDILNSSGSFNSFSEYNPSDVFTFCPTADPFSDSKSFDATKDDISTNSKTSALLNGLISVPPNADERYFASSLINHTGGEVALPGTGIRIVIPEGALDFGREEVIQLALTGNSDFIPKQFRASMLTPVVMCGPHGLRFKKHVLLILPHCLAVGDESEKEFKVHCSDTAPEDAPVWKEVFDANGEEQKDVFCHMGKRHFSLFVQHFSWYVIEGKGHAKIFNLAAYHTSFHQPNEDFKVRVYFSPWVENFTISQREVEKHEQQLRGTLGDSEKTKIFYKEGGDIKVEAIDISEEWKIRGGNVQTQGYEVLRYCPQLATPNLTFVFQHEDTRPQKIFCKFRASQDACKFDKPVDITISVHFEAEVKTAQQKQQNNAPAEARIPSTSSSGYAGSGENTTVAFIPTRLRKDLRELLDIEIVGIGNYEMLADRLGYDLQFIRWLGSPNIRSPTDTLLMKWENDQGSRSPRDALRHLQETLSKMNRVDAVDKIQECFDEFLIGKETTV